jgi:hypothetical protein
VTNNKNRVNGNESLCAHSGLVFGVMLGLGAFAVAGWLPPVLPSLNADQIAALFVQDGMRIRIGMSILALGSVFWWPFSAAIAMQMKRMEGDSHPLTYVQMAAASGTVVAVMIPAYIWLGAVYRPDQTPAGTLQVLNDVSWFLFIGAYPPAFLQNLAIGFCILQSKQPLYPRWVGFANLWAAVLFVPGALLPFFKTGPFAWNGIISFWLVATVFFGWIIMMWWSTLAAIKKSQ